MTFGPPPRWPKGHVFRSGYRLMVRRKRGCKKGRAGCEVQTRNVAGVYAQMAVYVKLL